MMSKINECQFNNVYLYLVLFISNLIKVRKRAKEPDLATTDIVSIADWLLYDDTVIKEIDQL